MLIFSIFHLLIRDPQHIHLQVLTASLRQALLKTAYVSQTTVLNTFCRCGRISRHRSRHLDTLLRSFPRKFCKYDNTSATRLYLLFMCLARLYDVWSRHSDFEFRTDELRGVYVATAIFPVRQLLASLR